MLFLWQVKIDVSSPFVLSPGNFLSLPEYKTAKTRVWNRYSKLLTTRKGDKDFQTGKCRCVYWSISFVFCVLSNFVLSKGPCNLHLNVKEGNKGRKMWLVFQFNVKRKNQEPVKKTINCQEKFPQFPIPSSCLLANGELGYFRFSRFLPQSHFLREKISSASSFLLSVELRFDGKQRQEWDLLLWHLDPTLQLSGAGPSAKWDTTRPDPGWQKIQLLYINQILCAVGHVGDPQTGEKVCFYL